jgi:hypothetical protein
MRAWLASFAIFLMIVILGFPLGDSKDYLKGAITVDKMTGSGEIEAITFHFKDFPYDVSTDCRLSSKNIGKYIYDGPKRVVYQYDYPFDSTLEESMQLNDYLSPFAGKIYESNQPAERSGYINHLVGFCALPLAHII